MRSIKLVKPFDYVYDYFGQLNNLGQNVEVDSGDYGKIEFSEGIHQAAALVHQQSRQDRKVIFIGNGGSAAVASHQAVDYWRNGNIPAISFNEGTLLTCVGNDFGYENVFSKPISMFTQSGDILIAISSSGQSKNILAGVRQAIQQGCHVITLSAFQADNPLRDMGDLNFYVPTDAYGFAEIMHLCICHCIIDGLISGDLPLHQDVPMIGKSRSQSA